MMQRAFRGQRAAVRSLPAPIGGWNVRDPLSAMDPLDAIRLDNWEPKASRVEVRRGVTVFARGFPDGPVETLLEFSAGGGRQLIAASADRLCRVAGDGQSVTLLGDGFANARWQGVSFNSRLILVNGADAPQSYDGTSLGAAGFTGSGLTASTLHGVAAHRNRLYLWAEDSQDVWYGGTDSVTGTLTRFPLGGLGSLGGTLACVGSWTRDGGAGADDIVAFGFSSGEWILYEGSDPGDALNWSLLGIFRLGAPVNRRALVKLGADLVAVTLEGYVSLAAVLSLDTAQAGPRRLSGKIQGAALDAVRRHGADWGWQVVVYPRNAQLIVNVPLADPGTTLGPVAAEQHVMNTETAAWCRFTGLAARCWGVHQDRLYFGGPAEGAAWNEAVWDLTPWYSGLIYQADADAADKAISSLGAVEDAAIEADGVQAFSDFRQPAQKRFTAARPVLSTDAELAVSQELLIDYQMPSDRLFTVSADAAAAGGVWGSAIWSQAVWASGLQVNRGWQSVGGVGFAAALRLRVLTGEQQTVWHSTDIAFERGGVL